MAFSWDMIADSSRDIAVGILTELRPPDLTIAPDGEDYLYRWHLARTHQGSVYFHIQVKDDPERPLHDHPWDNQSVILFGGYMETLCDDNDFCKPTEFNTRVYNRQAGDVIWRKAEHSHHLRMLPRTPYTMTLFSTGPRRRVWGFWYPDGWVPFTEVVAFQDGKSIHTGLKKVMMA